MERLGHCINNAMEQMVWSLLSLSRRGLALLYLFFADDLMLFCEADRRQATLINEILNDFGYFSSQKVNRGKSQVFFFS